MQVRDRCEKCGGFLPETFIFLPGQRLEDLTFKCGKCGQTYGFVPQGESARFIGHVKETP